MWRTLILTVSMLAALIYLMSPKEHCVCGVRIPEGGGMCECGEYNGRMLKIDRQRVFEEELRRLEEDRIRFEKLIRVIEELIEQDEKEHNHATVREKELKRIEEEKSKGNSYDTFL